MSAQRAAPQSHAERGISLQHDEPLPLYETRPPSIAPSYHTIDNARSNRPASLAPSYHTLDTKESTDRKRFSKNLNMITEDDEDEESQSKKRVACDKFLVALETEDLNAVTKILESKEADANQRLYASREVSSIHARKERIALSLRRTFYMSTYAHRYEGNGELPLWRATRRRRADMVKLLLRYGADPNTYVDEKPILRRALLMGEITIAGHLLEAGAEMNGPALLRHAIDNKERDQMELLMQYGADPNVAVGGERGLIRMINEPDLVAYAELLLSNGTTFDRSEVDGVDEEIFARQMADKLAFAVRVPFNNVAKFLLHKGADPNTQDGSIQSLQWEGYGELNLSVATCMKYDHDFSLLMSAVKSGNLETISTLLANGADVNAQSREGYTALMIATLEPATCLEKARTLLLYFALVDIRDTSGKTALFHVANPVDLSRRLAVEDFAELLLASGADPNAKDYDGQSILSYAVVRRAFWFVDLLLRHGVNVNAEDKDGNTPLLCLMRGYTYEAPGHHKDPTYSSWQVERECRLAESLLGHGADVNTRANDGYSALICVVERGFSCDLGEQQACTRIECLLHHEADINAQNSQKRTALMLAAELGYQWITRLLLSHGADAQIISDDGKSALGKATQKYFSQKNPLCESTTRELLAHLTGSGDDRKSITVDNLKRYIEKEFSADEWTAMEKVEVERQERVQQELSEAEERSEERKRQLLEQEVEKTRE